MSQQQNRRNILTPFSRHEFYDNTYLQRLRNDIQRLDKSANSANRSHVKGIAATPTVAHGSPRTPYLPATNNTKTIGLYTPHPPYSQNGRPLSNRSLHLRTPNNQCSNRPSRSPNRESHSIHTHKERSPSRNPVTPNLHHQGGASTVHRVPVTPGGVHQRDRSPSRAPITPNIHQQQLARNSEESRNPKNPSTDKQITNVMLLPQISKQPAGAIRGKTLSREKSNLALKASLQKRIPFPKIGMSELPSLTVTKKPVTPQTPGYAARVGAPDGHFSRKDQYLCGLTTTYQRDETVTTEILHQQQIGYDRLVISPSNLSVYSARSMPDSIHSMEDLSALAITGEKLTPHGSPMASPRASPRVSPRNSPHRISPAHSPQRISPAQSLQNLSYYHQPVVSSSQTDLRRSPAHSPISVNHAHTSSISRSNSRYRNFPPYVILADDHRHNPQQMQPLYRPFPNHLQRRVSDLSNNSLNDDVSLKNFLHHPPSHRPVVPPATHIKHRVSTQPIYNPVSVAVPLHPRALTNDRSVPSQKNRQSVSPSNIVFESRISPSLSRQSTNVRDMGTQTPRQHELPRKGARPQKPINKVRKSKKYNIEDLHMKQVRHVSTRVETEPTFMVERERPLHFASDALNFQGKPGEAPKQAVIVMKTTTTVRPNIISNGNVPGNYSRESTIHIDIAYDSNSSKPVVTSYTSAQSESQPQKAETTAADAPPIPETERRPSIGTTGPIPEIRMICATPEQLSTDSPTQPETPKSAPPASSTPSSQTSSPGDAVNTRPDTQAPRSAPSKQSTTTVSTPATQVATPVLA